MKKLAIAVLFISLCALPLYGAPRHPAKSVQSKAAHRIMFVLPETVNEEGQLFPSARKGYCSASALGPHALLTAQHCDSGETSLRVDNDLADRKIVGRITDGEDHIIFLVDGTKFKDTMAADYDPSSYALPTVGDKVFLFGDGGGFWPPQYRTGYYTGSVNTEEKDLAPTDPVMMLFDMNIIPGDSGSAVYGPNGELVTVVTYIISGKFAGCYKMAFTAEQVAKAEAF